ncbi:hypothetical protein EG240_10730 [Paenimyroides tangerinum]|uniref:Uncharacterized protein n=1 Tax=Paenimyroides tangerinum TaxID=2488728 RepID=A0A3P3WB53_9FLAO|nr:hypothetical protein [Paenimyroides tangerinum]RRJ89863.1 hypothetical protein EG240_10730 [Paenimyroides tangerinum]
MKSKLYITIFLISLSHFAFGQDGIFWSFEVKFKVDITDIKDQKQSKLLDFEILYEDSYYALASYNGSKLKFDTSKNEYTITIGYGSIGGQSDIHYVQCPEIYLKVNLEHDLRNNEKRKFFKLVPVYFENAKGSFQKYDLGTIALSEFLNGYIAGGKLKISSPYEIIEVKADKSVHKRRKDEYELRRMNKLVKLELQDEN